MNLLHAYISAAGRWTMGKWIFNLTQFFVILILIWVDAFNGLLPIPSVFNVKIIIGIKTAKLSSFFVVVSLIIPFANWQETFIDTTFLLLGLFIDYCANNEAKQLIRTIDSIFSWIVLQSVNRKPIRKCWPWYSSHLAEEKQEKHIRIGNVPPENKSESSNSNGVYLLN